MADVHHCQKCLKAKTEEPHKETNLDTLVLLSCELVGADRSHGDVGPDQVLVLVQEGEGVHPAEGGADHHHRGQAQTLAHLPQERGRG